MSLQYKFLNDLNGIDLEQQYNDFLCVLRHIAESCEGKTKLKRVTREKIKKEMSALNINYEKGVSVSEQIKWIERYHPNTISLYAMDPYGNVFEKYTAKQSRATLVYLCNNKHIYVMLLTKKYKNNSWQNQNIWTVVYINPVLSFSLHESLTQLLNVLKNSFKIKKTENKK